MMDKENFRVKSLNIKLREKPVQNRAELRKAPRGNIKKNRYDRIIDISEYIQIIILSG